MTAAASAAAHEVPWEAEDENDNMVKMLALLAAWRSCNSCSARVLYVDENARTDTQFVCGHCEERAKREFASAARMTLASGRVANDLN